MECEVARPAQVSDMLTLERLAMLQPLPSTASSVHETPLYEDEDLDDPDADVLPPPPAPFPIDQLTALLEASRAVAVSTDSHMWSDMAENEVRSEVDRSDAQSEAGSEATVRTVQYDYNDMTEINLVGIQRACVDCLELLMPHNRNSALLNDKDQELAAMLGDLLDASYELETFHPSAACCSPATPPSEEQTGHSPFPTLVHALLGAQSVVTRQVPPPSPASPSPLGAASSSARAAPAGPVWQEDAKWQRFETLSSMVVALVRARDERDATSDALPPRYRRCERDSVHSGSSHASGPPSYHDCSPEKHISDKASFTSSKIDRKSSLEVPCSPRSPTLSDFDSITRDLERYSHMAAQFDDQRVALRPSTKRHLREPSEDRMKELEELWGQIERVQGSPRYRGEIAKTMPKFTRTVSCPVDNAGQLAPALPIVAASSEQHADDDIERSQFLQELVESSAYARLRDQDVPLRSRAERQISQLPQMLERAPTRLESQDFPIPFEQFLANKLSERNNTVNSDRRSIRSLQSSSKSSTIKARKVRQASQRSKDLDVFEVLAGVSSGRLTNQDAPPPPRSRKAFLEALATGPPQDASATSGGLSASRPSARTLRSSSHRKPLTSALWLPRSASTNDLLAPLTYPSSISVVDTSVSRPQSPQPSRILPPPAPTSIRKFMGSFVRRGSFGGGSISGGSMTDSPKSAPRSMPLPIDPDSVGYVCEHQENLRTVQVMMYGGNTAGVTDLELEVATPGDAVVTSKSDPCVRITVALPTPVPLGQRVPLTSAIEDYVEAKLAALPTPSSLLTLNSSITHALSAPNLRQLAPRSLCCAQCDREIAEFPSNVQFKDLPSEHWAEMLEVWMCHADPAFTARIAQQTKDGFWPNATTVLVGGSYLLVAGGGVSGSHLVQHDSPQTDDWRVVSCPCGEVLGKIRQPGFPGAGTVRFSKWAISLMRGRGGGDIERVRYPVSCFVVSDMLELCQAHASHRFILADEASGTPRLAMWLFNPSMHVAYRRPVRASFSLTTFGGSGVPAGCASPDRVGSRLNKRYSSDRSSGRSSYSSTYSSRPDHHTYALARSLRAAKIMFKLLDGSDRGTEGLPGFGGQVETMRYPRDVCDSVIAALQTSAAVYPAGRRALGAFEAGFLERV